MFQLKFGALTLLGTERKRTCREGLGGLDDSSLRGLVKLIHYQVQVEKALVWLPRGNPKMDTAD